MSRLERVVNRSACSAGGRVFGGYFETIVRRDLPVEKRVAWIERRFRFHDVRHSFATGHVAAGHPSKRFARCSDTRA